MKPKSSQNSKSSLTISDNACLNFFKFLGHHAKLITIAITISIALGWATEIYKIHEDSEEKRYAREHTSSVTTVVHSPSLRLNDVNNSYHWIDESQASRNENGTWYSPYIHLTYQQKLAMIRFVNTVPNYNQLSGKEILNLYFENHLISDSDYKTLTNDCTTL